ncbi:hypothetical protein Tco_0912123 [Tanacetum coccineum]
MYDSWASRIRLFIKGKKHGRMMLDSIDNGPLVYPTVEEDGQTRPKKYSELTKAQQLQDDCDVQATISFFTANEGVVPKLCGVVAKVTSSLQGGDKEVKEARKVVTKHPTECKAFQLKIWKCYDSDSEINPQSKEILMANLSSCDSDVLTEEIQDAGIHDTNSSAPNDLLILSLVEQMTDQVANLDKENQTNKMVNESLSAELKRYKEHVTIFKQRQNVDLNTREKLIDSQMDDLIRNKNAKLEAFKQEIDTLKETLSNNVKEKESLSTALNVFKTESKEKEYNYINEEIVLEKHNKELENILCKLYRSTQAMHMLTKPQVF